MIDKKEEKKESIKIDKTREEIEELFSINSACDCSCCPHHCGEEK
jgi:hypothetical protein